MATRAHRKQQSLERILEAASRRLREEGLTGAAIAPVMEEAGLTHGAFYSHFANKDELAQSAFHHALDTGQPRWFEGGRREGETWPERLNRLAASYLSPSHRDNRANGCAIGTLVSQVPTATEAFKQAYRARVETTLQAICDEEDAVDDEQLDEAIVFLVLCIGGLNLSRAVDDPRLSARILAACRWGVARLTG
jgi:TetR/AcrR family transcriptional repressor of nem operon